MKKKPDRREMLQQNPQIREARVAEYLEFEERMKEQGFDLTPRYQVAQPLGRIESTRQEAASVTQSSAKR